jgi:PIN domain nuclease of toxin-antitoxin system
VRLLLDGHALIWAVDSPARLGRQAASAVADPANELLLSAGTIWEVSIKVGLGKLSLSSPFRQWMLRALSDLGATLLPITVEHADAQSALPDHHRDPFDRLLVAQAQIEQALLVSADALFDRYAVSRLW